MHQCLATCPRFRKISSHKHNWPVFLGSEFQNLIRSTLKNTEIWMQFYKMVLWPYHGHITAFQSEHLLHICKAYWCDLQMCFTWFRRAYGACLRANKALLILMIKKSQEADKETNHMTLTVLEMMFSFANTMVSRQVLWFQDLGSIFADSLISFKTILCCKAFELWQSSSKKPIRILNKPSLYLSFSLHHLVFVVTWWFSQ